MQRAPRALDNNVRDTAVWSDNDAFSFTQDSPFVLGALSAGLIAVTITILVIIGVWLRSKVYKLPKVKDARTCNVQTGNDFSGQSPSTSALDPLIDDTEFYSILLLD